MPDRFVTLDELRELVLPLARLVGELRARVDELEAERADRDAKITAEPTPEEDLT